MTIKQVQVPWLQSHTTDSVLQQLAKRAGEDCREGLQTLFTEHPTSLIAPAQRRTPRQRAIILSIGCLPGGQHLS